MKEFTKKRQLEAILLISEDIFPFQKLAINLRYQENFPKTPDAFEGNLQPVKFWSPCKFKHYQIICPW